MESKIITTDMLKQVTGYERSGDVERCLRDQGIRLFFGKLGPWTTLDLLNAAGGLRHMGQSTSKLT